MAEEDKAGREWIPTKEAAATFRISETALERAVKDGEVEARKVGKAVLVKIEAINKWIEAQPAVGSAKKESNG